MKKRDIATLTVGTMLGAALVGGAHAAAGVLAEPSWSPIYVDGEQVQMTAYNIAGNNYVKLRDIGQAVGFNVYYQNGVQVDSTAPYTGEAPAKTAPAQTAVRVSSYKGKTLTAGDRSGLIVTAGGVCTVTSSNPAVIAVENVSGNWVAIAKSAGTAVITATDGAGNSGSLTLTVEDAAADSIDLDANMDVRQEMIRLINQTRRENGVPELEVNEALMKATQYCAANQFREHGQHEWQAMLDYGWPHGASFNLTYFTVTDYTQVAQKAIYNWINSPGHFQTMISDTGTCVGTGVLIVGSTAYCFMAVGDPNSHSPL